MALGEIQLPADAAEAAQQLKEASRAHPVVVFKKSPICPVSTEAEGRFDAWRASASGCEVAVIDVIAQRSLARGLTSELGIKHESPQALVFRDGELHWHDSHWEITASALEQAVGG